MQCIYVLRTILAQRANTALNIVYRFFFTSITEMGRFLWEKTERLYIIWMNKRLVASLSPRWPGFDPSQSNCNWTQWHWVTLFNPVLRFSPVSILPPLLHTRRRLQTTLIRRTSGRRLETFKQSNGLRDIGLHWTAMSLHITLQIGTVPREI